MPARSCLVVLVDQRQVVRGLAQVVAATPKVRANAELLVLISIRVLTMARGAQGVSLKNLLWCSVYAPYHNYDLPSIH